MQRGKEKASPLKKVKGSRNTTQPPGNGLMRVMGRMEAARGMETSDRTTIQISQDTKNELDRIKQETSVKTYDDTVRFLLEERRRLRPSTFGLLSGTGPFVRDEEEDSHRIRSWHLGLGGILAGK
jgi:hypothetical protein